MFRLLSKKRSGASVFFYIDGGKSRFAKLFNRLCNRSVRLEICLIGRKENVVLNRGEERFKFRFCFNRSRFDLGSIFFFFSFPLPISFSRERISIVHQGECTTCDFPFSNNVPKGRSKRTTTIRSKHLFLGSFTSPSVPVDKQPVKIDNSRATKERRWKVEFKRSGKFYFSIFFLSFILPLMLFEKNKYKGIDKEKFVLVRITCIYLFKKFCFEYVRYE